ncbi:MAG: hypothetical protein HFE98_04800 [Ruminiclostridium sp.]|jgi:hypothetical protein|nr:hypothetical protein [Ruminiclostridium sp.]MCI9465978.1 hypothetical protein [Ruminiclostridium sp.]
MAKKHGLGGMLFFGAVTAALGGIAAYRHRKEIEETLQSIADQLEGQEEDGFFSVELEDLEEPIVHVTDPLEEETVEPAAPESMSQETPPEA